MNENEVKVFTLDEANELLPVLSELIGALQEKRGEVTKVELEVDAHELMDVQDAKSESEFQNLIEKHQRLVDEFYAIVDEIHSYGCFLKDADLGLVDFYSAVDGRPVFLCWRFGEEGINFWHEIESGYTSRKPINEH